MALICSIELSKERGVTVKVVDDQGKVTQTVELDGTKMTLQVKTNEAETVWEQRDASIRCTVKKGSDQTEIEQSPTNIELRCKNFLVEAESVDVSATKDMSLTAKGKGTLKTRKDLTLQSSAKATLKATRDVSVDSGTKLKLEGGTQASLAAPQIALKASAKASIDGGTQLQLTAIKVQAKGKAQLEAAAPITNVGQALTSVKGSLLKLEGALIKMG